MFEIECEPCDKNEQTHHKDFCLAKYIQLIRVQSLINKT